MNLEVTIIEDDRQFDDGEGINSVHQLGKL